MKLRPLLSFLLVLLGVTLVCSRASAVLLTERGFEPILVQVKESLRLSSQLNSGLQRLSMVENRLGLAVVQRFVGLKYIELLSFPQSSTEAEALAAIFTLQGDSAVEKVVAYSAFNLEFRPADFNHAYQPNEYIPEAVRRGLDSGPAFAFDPAVVLQPHAPNQVIVAWKPEFIWHAAQTGFLQQMAAFNASVGCRVIGDIQSSAVTLEQVLEFDGPDAQLALKLQQYLATGWVEYAEPNYLYFASGDPAALPQPIVLPEPNAPSVVATPREASKGSALSKPGPALVRSQVRQNRRGNVMRQSE